ncbi:MAG: CPBP family intramembrane metalloprotease [Chlamydiia bacterium]|nr:CPBP family intramembrane metalloprotease [Chlamydiia bacterium]
MFFAIYYYGGNFLLQKLVWPALERLPDPFRIGLHPFFELDFGRIVNRIFQFFWTLALFFLFMRFVQRKPLKENILFKPRHKLRTTLWGMLFGACLVGALITLSIATKIVVVKAVHLYPDDLFETLALYLFCMAITAISEEIALRGTILETMRASWGTHWAVWISACFFGLIYIGESYYYAYAAFVAGLLLGYAYVWYGIYYCIGWHFAWNFIESVFYSGKIVLYQVNDPFLVGDKTMMPDQEGLLILPILLIGLALMLAVHKTEWRLDSKAR